MTPEELNRTIEFIVQSQARLAAAQEQDREDRTKFEEWSKGITAQVVRLLDHQSQRMDRIDKLHDDLVKELREFRTENKDFHQQTLHLLNLILDRLPLPPMTT